MNIEKEIQSCKQKAVNEKLRTELLIELGKELELLISEGGCLVPAILNHDKIPHIYNQIRELENEH